MQCRFWMLLLTLTMLVTSGVVGCGGDDDFVDPRASTTTVASAARENVLGFVRSEVAFLKEKDRQQAADYAIEFLETLEGYCEEESEHQETFTKLVAACKEFQEAAAGSATVQQVMAKLKAIDELARQLPASSS
jgi:hypothetical protein